jgi:hypothetical protein
MFINLFFFWHCKNDLFPEEGVWLWKDGMPLLSALRKLSVGTLLGSEKERQVNWYLNPTHLEKLLSQLTPHLDKIAQIILHYAISVCDIFWMKSLVILPFSFLARIFERKGWAVLAFLILHLGFTSYI